MIHKAALRPFPRPGKVPIATIKVELDVERRRLSHVVFHAVGTDQNFVAPDPIPHGGRADSLWQHTCFEVFARTRDGSYAEFNLSPSGQWAAYGFDGYRSGMADLGGGVRFTRISRTRDGLTVEAILDWRQWPQVTAVALSAVIEAKDGSLSYWALAHPSDKPDFHHPDSFVLDLP